MSVGIGVRNGLLIEAAAIVVGFVAYVWWQIAKDDPVVGGLLLVEFVAVVVMLRYVFMLISSKEAEGEE